MFIDSFDYKITSLEVLANATIVQKSIFLSILVEFSTFVTLWLNLIEL